MYGAILEEDLEIANLAESIIARHVSGTEM
jgi:hypothetical protein